MVDEKVEAGAIEVVQQAGEAVIETIAGVTETLTNVAQNSGVFEIFGVPFWESIITFLIVLLIYNLAVHKLFIVSL